MSPLALVVDFLAAIKRFLPSFSACLDRLNRPAMDCIAGYPTASKCELEIPNVPEHLAASAEQSDQMLPRLQLKVQ